MTKQTTKPKIMGKFEVSYTLHGCEYTRTVFAKDTHEAERIVKQDDLRVTVNSTTAL